MSLIFLPCTQDLPFFHSSELHIMRSTRGSLWWRPVLTVLHSGTVWRALNEAIWANNVERFPLGCRLWDRYLIHNAVTWSPCLLSKYCDLNDHHRFRGYLQHGEHPQLSPHELHSDLTPYSWTVTPNRLSMAFGHCCGWKLKLKRSRTFSHIVWIYRQE